jgi:hypothetical protein
MYLPSASADWDRLESIHLQRSKGKREVALFFNAPAQGLKLFQALSPHSRDAGGEVNFDGERRIGLAESGERGMEALPVGRIGRRQGERQNGIRQSHAVPVWRRLPEEIAQKTKARSEERAFSMLCRRSPNLPHTFACSTIGPARLNFRVRDGNGWDPRGMVTGKLWGSQHAITRWGRKSSDAWRDGFPAATCASGQFLQGQGRRYAGVTT